MAKENWFKVYGKDGKEHRVRDHVDYKELLAQKDGFYSAEPQKAEVVEDKPARGRPAAKKEDKEQTKDESE